MLNTLLLFIFSLAAVQGATSNDQALTLHLESISANVRIVNNVATTEIEQTFRNERNSPVEEQYLWPIPEGASVTQFQLWMDGKPMSAEVLDKETARGVYERIVMSRRDPGLLEWAGQGCVRASIFPVPARGTAKVKLQYSHLIHSTGPFHEYVLPLRLAALAPRGVRSFVIDGSVESDKQILTAYSPTHTTAFITTDKISKFSFETNDPSQVKDFSLLYANPGNELGSMAVAHRTPGEDGFFSLVFNPNIDANRTIPKDVIFVCDTSGSMRGEKIEQAKLALDYCIRHLEAHDRFALIRFGSEVSIQSEKLLDKTNENVEEASNCIRNIEAAGGTNIHDALSAALRLVANENRLAMILFITDGIPTVGSTDVKEILRSVESMNRRKTRIFTFGVGVNVNTVLLDSLADTTRGITEYARPEENIEIKISALFDKVSSPVVTDTTILLDGLAVSEIYPKRLPDLFRGGRLVVAGRYQGAGITTIRVLGNVAGETREWNCSFNFPAKEERYDSIRKLWAARKVGFLLDEIRKNGNNPELVDEIKSVGRKYHIITPYTSFLVVEDGERLAAARGVDASRLRGDGTLTNSERGEAAAARKRFETLATNTTGASSVDASEAADLLSKQTGGFSSPDPPSARPGRRPGVPSPPTGGSSPATPAPGGPTTPAAGGPTYPGPADTIIRTPTIPTLQKTTRTVGARVFQLIDTVWVESAFTESYKEKIVKIQFLSNEYFSLLKKEPSLAACFALGKRVVVKVGDVFYEIHD
ncbi:MAG: VIT domain-containing protein [Planctomycetota bacterium]